MSRRRKWLVGMALLAVAILLNLSLTKFATNIITTYADDHVTQTIYSAPLLVPWFSVTDFACFKDVPCKLAAVARESGFYARGQVSGSLAMLLGLVLPYGLFIAALYFFLESLFGWWRRAAAGLIILCSLPIVVLFVLALYLGFVKNSVPPGRLLHDPTFVLLLLASSTAFLGLAEAFRLLKVRPAEDV